MMAGCPTQGQSKQRTVISTARRIPEGPSTSGTVFHLTSNGVENLLHTFNSSVDGGAPGGLVEGNDGNFYATVGTFFSRWSVSGSAPDGVLTMLHTFGGGPNDAAFSHRQSHHRQCW